MKIPLLRGIIRRRFLVNYRVDPAVLRNTLPSPFRPKLHLGHAIAGICLIRLEEVRPAGVPALFGLTSENAAHRVAVEWTDAQGHAQEGVFIYRRDSDSTLGHLAGGRLFPGVHHVAKFRVQENGPRIAFALASRDGKVALRLCGEEADALPTTSCFRSLAESSRFFECGCVGYSPAADGIHLEGLRLETTEWNVRAFTVSELESSWFTEITKKFPGAVKFDHALIMHNIPHRWHTVGGPV